MAVYRKPQNFPKSPSRSLQCALCLQSYQDARILPCFHTFCADCLESACLQKMDSTKPATVYCPICLDETELPVSGVQGLPQNMYVQHLKNLQEPTSPVCDLCTDKDLASLQCESCQSYLCEFCATAHKRQRSSADHTLVAVEQSLTQRSQKKAPKVCAFHANEVQSLFCDTCSVAVCGKCVSGRHSEHTFLPLDDVNMQYAEVLQSLLLQSKPLVKSVNESIRNIEFTMDSIQERAEKVAQEISSDIDARMQALHEHKRSLLTRLDALVHHKEKTLELQLEESTKTLESLTISSSAVNKALREENPSSLFTPKHPLISRLEELVHAKYDLSPKEEDYIKYCVGTPAGKVLGFDMVGVIDGRGPSAAHTVVEGEGTFKAWQKKTASFHIAVKDKHGEIRSNDTDEIEVTVTDATGSRVETEISRNGKGIYKASYTPRTSGEHRISVVIDGKNVKASPFVVQVCSKMKQHSGHFHCCTFCSSGGMKHVRCGCGSSMPGGYSGCGHGHPGHPGCPHWSCCGSTQQDQSECLL